MKNKTSYAFTLIEVLVVMAIIGMLVAMTPRFMSRKPQEKVSFVLQQFNRFADLAKQEAIMSGKIHRISLNSNAIKLEIAGADPSKPGVTIFTPVVSPYLKTEYNLPKFISLHNIFLDGKTVFDRYADQAYIHIASNGMIQPVFVQIEATKDGIDDRYTFKMQPFLGKFEQVGGWVKE